MSRSGPSTVTLWADKLEGICFIHVCRAGVESDQCARSVTKPYPCRMELRQLRYFVAAAEEQHMTRAAQRVHISQPALSEQIRDLEDELGFPLFERLPRGIRLSHAGQVFLEHVRRILADVEVARERSREAGRGEVGHLRIAFNELAGQQRMVGRALQAFRTTYPNVMLDMVQLTAQQQLEALHQGSIDAGFQHNQGQDREAQHFLRLRVDRFVLAVPPFHPLASRKRIRLADLAQVPQVWMHRSVNPQAHEALRGAFATRGIVPLVVQEAHSDVAILNLVSVGLGVGLVVSARRWGESDSVVMKQVADLSLALDFGLAWSRANASPLLANFVAVLEQASPDAVP